MYRGLTLIACVTALLVIHDNARAANHGPSTSGEWDDIGEMRDKLMEECDEALILCKKRRQMEGITKGANPAQLCAKEYVQCISEIPPEPKLEPEYELRYRRCPNLLELDLLTTEAWEEILIKNPWPIGPTGGQAPALGGVWGWMNKCLLRGAPLVTP